MRQALHCIVLTMALLCAASVSANTELLKTREGSLVHWTRGEITVGLVPSGGSNMVTQEGVMLAIRRAAQAWNAIRAGQPQLHFVTEPRPDVTIKFCRGKWRGDTIDLGNSQFTADLRDGTVEAATVELNECDYHFAAPDEAARGRHDLQSVITHELGHVLGLGHGDNPAAIMYPRGGGVGVRTPHTEDKTALAIIYFGRAMAQPERALAEDDSRRLADPDRVTPRPRERALGDVPAGPTSGPPTSANELRGPGAAAPTNLVSVLNLTTSGGRQVLVYTCEPTLLPPLTAAPSTQDDRRPSRHRRR